MDANQVGYVHELTLDEVKDDPGRLDLLQTTGAR